MLAHNYKFGDKIAFRKNNSDEIYHGVVNGVGILNVTVEVESEKSCLLVDIKMIQNLRSKQMNIVKFFQLCQIFSDLGANMQCQLMTIVREFDNGADDEEIAEAICNHNSKELPLIQEALKEIVHFMGMTEEFEELSHAILALIQRLQKVIDGNY